MLMLKWIEKLKYKYYKMSGISSVIKINLIGLMRNAEKLPTKVKVTSQNLLTYLLLLLN